MKKLLALFALSIFTFGSYAITNTTPKQNTNNLSEQDPQKNKVQKQSHYDFSLFKFITPQKELSPKDSLKKAVESPKKQKEFREETTQLYESPRCFLMFS